MLLSSQGVGLIPDPSFYRGFVWTDGKKSRDKFKDGAKLRTFEEVQQFQSYAGVLAHDSLLVDIDDARQADILLNIIKKLQINTVVFQTTRGKHFLFKNTNVETNKTHTLLAVGLFADIKMGARNAYQALKVNGVEREIVYSSDKIDDLPMFLSPIKAKTDFTNMTEGDGRNQALFNYILILQKHGFNKEQIKDVINLINDFVLASPLNEEELNVILRDEAFVDDVKLDKSPSFFNGNYFKFYEFANFLLEKHHIIKLNDRLHIFDGTIYRNSLADIESVMIRHIKSLNKTKRGEVLAYLDLIAPKYERQSPSHLIAFKNGVLNINTDELLPFSHEYIITNKINVNYNTMAYNHEVNNILNDLAVNDTHVRLLLEEVIGYCLYRGSNSLGKAFILTGSGSNGKSTFLNAIKTILGEENHSVLDLKKLSDRFSTVMLFNKLANIGDDISSEYIADSATFKKLVTGESVDAEQKGQPKFNFKPYAKMLFSANAVPRIGNGRDNSAILRRLVIIPFNAHFSGDKIKHNISDIFYIQEAQEYLIDVGVRGLKRVLKNRDFTINDEIKNQMVEFEEMNNPVLGFFKDRDRSSICGLENKAVYQMYLDYCRDNNLNPLCSRVFGKELCQYYGVTSKQIKVRGEVTRIYQV